MSDLWTLGLSRRSLGILERAGISDIGGLCALNARELRGLHGLGEKSLGEIVDALAGPGLGQLADDPYAPFVCARLAAA